MARRGKFKVRTPAPDPRFNSILVARFINKLMWDGKKTVAQRIFYKALELAQERTGEDGYAVFQKAINNVKPVLEVRPRRVGGATYQIPMEVPPQRRDALAIKWIVESARGRSEHTMIERLAGELVDASRKQGGRG